MSTVYDALKKAEAERNKAIGNSKRNGPVAAGAPSFIEIE